MLIFQLHVSTKVQTSKAEQKQQLIELNKDVGGE